MAFKQRRINVTSLVFVMRLLGALHINVCVLNWPLLPLALVTRYRDPGQNIRYHFVLLNAALADLPITIQIKTKGSIHTSYAFVSTDVHFMTLLFGVFEETSPSKLTLFFIFQITFHTINLLI